jgi:hypothetical protein
VKKPNRLLKLAAVLSSLLLAAGFVSYRAGAFSWLQKPSTPPPPAEPQNIPFTLDNMFYSSKSGPIFVPANGEQQTPTVTQELSPSLMPGSKSILIVPPTAPSGSTTPASQQPSPPSR